MRNQIDPVRIGEELMHRVFYDVFHHAGARQEFGFSQISGFCDDEGMPGWNLWFSQDRGAYQIFLMQADVVPQGEAAQSGSRVTGRFAIRYFPGKDDSTLADYSSEEIRLRGGPCFDHTGTLTVGGMQAMDRHLFLAGFLDFRTDLDRQFLELSCLAPNRWREAHSKAPAVLCRNAPGWLPAMRLFDKLVTGFCHVHHTAPECAVAADKKWWCLDIAGDGEAQPRLDPDIDLHAMVVGFRLGPDVDGLAFSSLRQRLARDGFGHVRAVQQDSGHEWSDWWAVKDRDFSLGREAELCTCYQDH